MGCAAAPKQAPEFDPPAREELERRRDALASLAAVFLKLPTPASVEAALRAGAGAETGGEARGSYAALLGFARQAQGRPLEEVLLDVARERVLLVRGAGVGHIVPPYESLYAGRGQNEVVGSLNRFYAACGFAKLEEVRDAADQIGVECAFAAALLDRQLAQLDAGDAQAAQESAAALRSFMAQHLGRWADDYAAQVAEHATLGYWRAVGLLLRETVADL